MDNIKEVERAELHKTIWAIANDLRGSVDGWDFKSYVLGMLFYRYISENLTNFINENERESGNTDFVDDTFFYKVDSAILNNVLAVYVDSTVDTDQFLINCGFDVKAVRNISRDGLPY